MQVAAGDRVFLACLQLEHQVRAPVAQAASHHKAELLSISGQEDHVSPLVKRRLQQSGLESLAGYLL